MNIRERLSCAAVCAVVLVVGVAMFYVATEPTYNAIEMINGDMYVIDYNLTLEDCVSTGAPICEEN